jgi:hypothetical protein
MPTDLPIEPRGDLAAKRRRVRGWQADDAERRIELRAVVYSHFRVAVGPEPELHVEEDSRGGLTVVALQRGRFKQMAVAAEFLDDRAIWPALATRFARSS